MTFRTLITEWINFNNTTCKETDSNTFCQRRTSLVGSNSGQDVLAAFVEDDQAVDIIQLQKKLLKSHDMPGQLFPLDIAEKNIGLPSSEMIYAILVTIIQKR